MRVICVFLFSLALFSAEPSETLSHVYTFQKPVIKTAADGTQIALKGCLPWREPGRPDLPVMYAALAIRPGDKVLAVNVTGLSEKSYQLDRPLEPSDGFSGNPYPARRGRLINVSKKHGCPIALLAIFPVTHEPGSRRIMAAEKLEVELVLGQEAGHETVKAGLSLTRPDHRELSRLVDNPARLPAPARPAKDGDQGTYVIICPEQFSESFTPLRDLYTQYGIANELATLEWIAQNFSGERPDGQIDEATRIRQYIRWTYENLDTRFVLLAGDADAGGDIHLPVRYLKTPDYPTLIPSDVYYGCLDGTFDHNANGIYGENNDGEAGADVDLLFEVHVSRAPVDSPAEAQRFVAKTLAYHQAGGEALRKVLLVGEHLDQGKAEWGGDLLDHILGGSSANNYTTQGFEDSPIGAFYQVSTLYDRGYPGSQWPDHAVLDAINGNVHLMAHAGHGDLGTVMRLHSGNLPQLANDIGFILYSEACNSGGLDNTDESGEYFNQDCIAEQLLTGQRGAVGMVANTRLGWVDENIIGGPSHHFHRHFWDGILGKGILHLAEANDAAKEANAGYAAIDTQARWCYYGLMTFGDPYMIIKRAGQRAILALNQPYYFLDNLAEITLIDQDLDLDPQVRDQASVTVTAEDSGEQATLMLEEVGTATGVFKILFDLNPDTCPITFTRPDALLVAYQDQDDGTGQSADISASAAIVQPLQTTLPDTLTVLTGQPFQILPEMAGGKGPYHFAISDQEDYIVRPASGCMVGAAEPRDWHADDQYWNDTLSINFPFWGQTYDRVKVSSNGFLEFWQVEAGHHYASEENLRHHVRIAVVWRDLTTEGNSGIFYTHGEDFCGFIWRGVEDYHSQVRLEASVTLFQDGRICISRDPPEGSMCGISAGDGVHYILLEDYPELLHERNIMFYPGGIPKGMDFNDATGALAGVPQTAGVFHLMYTILDDSGQKIKRPVELTVQRNPLTLLAPGKDEYLHIGDTYPIRWQYPDTEATFTIRYNTDGALDAFPHVIASNLSPPLDTFHWDVPDAKSGDCRLQITSSDGALRMVSQPFSIVDAAFVVEAPAEDATLISGTAASIAWRNLGDTGQRVSIYYNTTGEEDHFPGVLAQDIENTGSAAVQVPFTPGSTCRLKIQSSASQDIIGTSDVFAIRLPYFEISAPGEKGCFRSGTTESITWLNIGNPGDHVTITYNLTGNPDAFPLALTAGPIENTGEFPWAVPAGDFPFCRLKIQSQDHPNISAMSPIFSIGEDCHRRVLLWIPFINEDEEEIWGTKRAFTALRPDLELVFSKTIEPQVLAGELADIACMVMVQQEDYPQGTNFTQLGAAFADTLENFAALGGSVIICRQWKDSESFLPGTGLMQTEFLDAYESISCTSVDMADPLCHHVSPQFNGPNSTASYHVEGPNVRQVIVNGNETIVACRDMGFGRIVLLGFDFFTRNQDSSQLLVNAALVPEVTEGIRFFRPTQDRVVAPGQSVPIRWAVKGGGQQLSLLSYNLDGNADTFPLSQSVQPAGGIGSWDWIAPEPGPDDHYLCRFKVALEDAGHIQDVALPTIVVSHPLAIDGGPLPELSLRLPYQHTLTISGGVPPFNVTADNLPAGLSCATSGSRGISLSGMVDLQPGDRTIPIIITDAAGQTGVFPLDLSMVKRQLTLVSPVGGEYFLQGETIPIQWQQSGQVGSTVSIAYNTDGSPDDFPHVLAQQWPITDSFPWPLPLGNLAACRICVTSNDYPEFRAVSGAFTITPQTIMVISPSGYRCVEYGKATTIQWVSVGIETPTVSIFCNTDGSEADFPVTIAEDVPNSGSHEWRVPDEFIDQCRIKVCSPDNQFCGISQGTIRVTGLCGLQTTFFGRYADSQGIQAIRQDFLDMSPDMGADTLTALPGQGHFSGLKVFVFCPESPESGVDNALADGAQLAGAGLEAFIRNGGSVILCAPEGKSLECLEGAGVISGSVQVAAAEGDQVDVLDPLHPLAAGMPRHFTSPRTPLTYEITDDGFMPVFSINQKAVVAAKNMGNGWIVVLGFDGVHGDANLQRLFFNALTPSRVPDGLAIMTPRPGDVFFADEPIPVSWICHGPLQHYLLEYSLDVPPQSFTYINNPMSPFVLNNFTWYHSLKPPADAPHACTLRLRHTTRPDLSFTLPDPFYIVNHPAVSPAELPTAVDDTPYQTELTLSGGMPPYTVSLSGLPDTFTHALDNATLTLSGIMSHGQGPLPFTVTFWDSQGNEHEQAFELNSRPPMVSVSRPPAMSRFTVGETIAIQWTSDGYLGDAISLSCNTDGSSDTFPHMIAEGIPASEPFSWTAPDEAIGTCRIQVSGTAGFSHIKGVSHIFSINRPGFRFIKPSSDLCVQSGKPCTVVWESFGNAAGAVNLACSIDGNDQDFPELIKEGIPDTGEFTWIVPPIRSRKVRLKITSTDGSLSQVSPMFCCQPRCGVSALLWIPFLDEDQAEIWNTIAAITLNENDFNWTFSRTLDPYRLREELAAHDALIIMEQEQAQPDVDFAGLGETLGPVMEDFVRRGHAAIHLRQIGPANDFLKASGLLDITPLGSHLDLSCKVISPRHPVCEGVPLIFNTSATTTWYETADPDAVSLCDSSGRGSIVIAKEMGLGRLVAIGCDYSLYTEGSARLLSNALRMIPFSERPRFVRGDANIDGHVDIGDVIHILSYLFGTGAPPLCLDAADINDDAYLGNESPINLADPVYLLDFLFGDGPTIPAPFKATSVGIPRDCGHDLQHDDGLDCMDYHLCND